MGSARAQGRVSVRSWTATRVWSLGSAGAQARVWVAAQRGWGPRGGCGGVWGAAPLATERRHWWGWGGVWGASGFFRLAGSRQSHRTATSCSPRSTCGPAEGGIGQGQPSHKPRQLNGVRCGKARDVLVQKAEEAGRPPQKAPWKRHRLPTLHKLACALHTFLTQPQALNDAPPSIPPPPRPVPPRSSVFTYRQSASGAPQAAEQASSLQHTMGFPRTSTPVSHSSAVQNAHCRGRIVTLE